MSLSIFYGPKGSQSLRKAVVKAEAQEAAAARASADEDPRRKASSSENRWQRQPVPEPANPPRSVGASSSQETGAARPEAPKIPFEGLNFKPDAAEASRQGWLDLLNLALEMFERILPAQALETCSSYPGQGVKFEIDELDKLLDCIHDLTAQALRLGELHWPLANRVLELLKQRKFFPTMVTLPRRKPICYTESDSTPATGTDYPEAKLVLSETPIKSGRGEFERDSWVPQKYVWEEVYSNTVVCQMDGAKPWEILERIKAIISKHGGSPESLME